MPTATTGVRGPRRVRTSICGSASCTAPAPRLDAAKPSFVTSRSPRKPPAALSRTELSRLLFTLRRRSIAKSRRLHPQETPALIRAQSLIPSPSGASAPPGTWVCSCIVDAPEQPLDCPPFRHNFASHPTKRAEPYGLHLERTPESYPGLAPEFFQFKGIFHML